MNVVVQPDRRGFTIVELLIVIVVIAILAAITIVAYTGIQERARASAMQSAASQEAKKAPLYAVDNTDLFPVDEATFFAFANLADTSETDYNYLVSPDRTHYCVSATSVQNTAISYAVSDTSGGTVEGRCVRNISANPSFEVNNGVNSYATTISRPTSGGQSGDRYVRATRTGTTGNWGMWWDAANGTEENHEYAFSFMSRQSVSVSRDFMIEWLNAAKSSIIRRDTLQTQTYGSSWTQFKGAGVSPSASFNIRIAFYAGSTGTTSDYVDIDSIIITEGTTPYQFADGSSSGWSWDGAENVSTSFGPAKQL